MKIKNMLVILIAIILSSGVSSLASENSIIRVTGQGSITVNPDICTVEFSVITKDKDQKKAMDLNNSKNEKLKDSFKKAGIGENDIVTQNFDITPPDIYSTNNGEIRDYYIVRNTTEVTIRNIAEIGKYIEIGNKNGADSIGYLRYDLSDGQNAYNQALKMAIDDAKSKTGLIANTLGVKIKGITLVEETSRNYYSPKIKTTDAVMEMNSDLNIETQKLNINANINMESIY